MPIAYADGALCWCAGLFSVEADTGRLIFIMWAMCIAAPVRDRHARISMIDPTAFAYCWMVLPINHFQKIGFSFENPVKQGSYPVSGIIM